MRQHRESPSLVAAQIRTALRDGGSSEHASGVQWFFKEEIKSHGWYTADLRRAVRGFRRELFKKHDLEFLVTVSGELFHGSNLEEKIAAVFLLEKMDAQFGNREFRLFESWLDRISSWADHDGLVHYLIAPTRTFCSKIKTIWCRRAWDGCCGRRRSMTPNVRCLI
jgi:3-methyladenine DNA glycosylase AlkD